MMTKPTRQKRRRNPAAFFLPQVAHHPPPLVEPLFAQANATPHKKAADNGRNPPPAALPKLRSIKPHNPDRQFARTERNYEGVTVDDSPDNSVTIRRNLPSIIRRTTAA